MLSESIFKKIDEVIVEQNKDYRGHLGFSIIGDTDERKLWLKFNWCLTSSFEGRMLRLFDLGNRIEDQVIDNISDTKVIGVSPLDKDGNQYRASAVGGHFAGSCDGFVRKVLPDFPDTVLVLEVKSANDKRFKELVKLQDYQGWSQTYQWQIHSYMGIFGVTKTLIVVVNKNNNEIYSEIIDYNPSIWEQAQEKANRIIASDAIPDGLSEKDWRLKNETTVYREVYLGNRLPTSVNCRNCTSSKAITESNGAVWWCFRHNKNLALDEQKNGCQDHLWMPVLVPADHLPDQSTEDKIAYQSGIVKFFNSTKENLDANSFSSPELRELSKAKFDAEIMTGTHSFRDSFDARFVSVHVMDEDQTPF